ncbi:MAG: allantoate amidohydrolase [Pseudolabrys sp.]|nr:allantoate amidohydrolase [Pseudolabrys sp.]
MADLDPRTLGERAERMILALGAISAEPRRLTRQFLSPEHRRAADLVGTWMKAAGLDVTEDALGTVRGHWASAGEAAGRNTGKRLLIGSHIDTVIDAGFYDGNLGVVAGILAAEHFAKAGKRLPFALDVLAFGDEEGVRFPATLNSSRAVSGEFREAALDLKDADGVTLREAILRYGKDPADIPAAAFSPDEVAGYVELHIEQGPVLENRNQPLGVVTAIAGQSYLSVELMGEAGHAGTVPMMMRRDALAGAAEIVLQAERMARDSRGEVVATVGVVTISAPATNVIAGHVVLIIDIRSGSDPARHDFVDRLKSAIRTVADRRHLGLQVTQTRNVATTPCTAAIQDGFAAAIAATGGEPLRLASGAGHDATAMARLCPVGMMFVRCRGGVSHNPAEYASPGDMGLAVAALIRFIEGFKA